MEIRITRRQLRLMIALAVLLGLNAALAIFAFAHERWLSGAGSAMVAVSMALILRGMPSR